jgi:hypothetical protein
MIQLNALVFTQYLKYNSFVFSSSFFFNVWKQNFKNVFSPYLDDENGTKTHRRRRLKKKKK